jgi:16S rRNA (guanine527-N7)-methyltransferase
VRLGLVAESDAGRLLERHVVDSLRAVRAFREGDRSAYDLGSGAGLPGVPIAIAKPGVQVVLVESRRRRAAWLESVLEELALENASVLNQRIERIERVAAPVDVCLARALGPVRRCWELARPLLGRGGRLVYFAGQSFEATALGPLSHAADILDEPGLESRGPIVIIARQ